jgi:hypothetical protein
LIHPHKTLHSLLRPRTVQRRVTDTLLVVAAILDHIAYAIDALDHAAVLALIVGSKALKFTLSSSQR